MDLSDMYESEAYKELRAFYERLPIAASTKQVLDARPEIFKKLAAAESLEKQQEVIALIRKEEDELLKDDPVYVKVTGYIEAIGEESLAGGDYLDDLEEDVRDDEEDEKKGGDSTGEGIGMEVSGYYDTMVTQRGDIVFLDARGRAAGNSYQAHYAKDWTHVGLYAMNNQVYDSYPGECPANAVNTGGVALRNAGEYFFKSGSRLMMAQLSNASQRPTQSATLTKAQNRFGTDCRTPFEFSLFSKSNTSSFYCSKLVWRAYKDSDDYPVDLDNNSYHYFFWLSNSADGRVPLGFGIAWFIVFSTVSPDEIALSEELNNYARYRYQ